VSFLDNYCLVQPPVLKVQ